MRRVNENDRRLVLWLATSPLLMQSIAENHARNGSRFLMPCFVAVCALGVLFAIAGWL